MLALPAPVSAFFRRFPLATSPAVRTDTARPARPTLWVAPPTPDIVVPSTNLLSADVECLKWQAYIALRALKAPVAVRWDIDPEGAVGARLPTLCVPPPADGKPADVLGPRLIPAWVDDVLGKAEQDAFEGYRDEAAKDESRAWVAVLEGIVHVALTLATPEPFSLTSLLLHFPAQSKSHSLPGSASVAAHLSPPPAPLSGIASLFPPYGERVSSTAVQSQYHDAIVALSDRLGSDEWLLASPGPTALDALLFAYLHCLLAGPDEVRLDVVRRANLVAWERRVRVVVQSAFVRYP